ncbi:hypothetical protein O6H91_11G047700 [Diphasiastrum complanatum]|uniref:Uncharacterized protein n=1 Tax=Diphasiastrum complanatum TaxID=34168 RepID=A0ACC2C8S0_DIPCM|nr:hypothetical protein O6H91_11G047700 [Diphasiastrum complanatum]
MMLMPVDQAALNNVFLEDWIVAAANAKQAPGEACSHGNKGAPVQAAHRIAYSWTQIRDCVRHGVLQPQHCAAMDYLREHSRSVHVAEAQAKLLVLLLTSVTAEDWQSLARVRGSSALILSIYIRRMFRSGRSRSSRVHAASTETLMSIVEATCKSLAEPSVSDGYVCEAILLLGSVCIAPQCGDDIKDICRRVILEEFNRRREVITTRGLLQAFSGAGNAMVGAHGSILSAFLKALLQLSTFSGSERSRKDYRIESSLFLYDKLLLLHLMEFQGLMIHSYEESVALSDANVMLEVLFDGASERALPEVRCASVMASCGLLKSFHKKAKAGSKQNEVISNSFDLGLLDIRSKLESLISDTARQGILSLKENTKLDVETAKNWQHGTLPFRILKQLIKDDDFSAHPTIILLRLLQCIALGVTRSGSLSVNPYIICCLLYILLQDVLSLAPVYFAQIADLSHLFTSSAKENHADSDGSHERLRRPALQSQLTIALDFLRNHVKGCLFQEVGAIARAMCEQYQLIHPEYQQEIEALVWQNCQSLYQRHRIFVALCSEEHSERHRVEGFPHPFESLQEENISKVLEAYFLFVVLFFSLALDHKISEKKHSVENNIITESEDDLNVQLLDSLSCVEFFRQVQVPEYGSLVQRSVSRLCASKLAASAFVLCCPSYHDMTQWPGRSELQFATYDWNLDQVQAARVHFYFRVLCSCLGQISESTFEEALAPKMFLYIQHAAEAVARSSHALFTAFLSLGEDSAEQESPHETLREKLSVYYIQRSLEAYPEIVSFEGMISGVGAIAHYLPPGSPATIYCINSLADKITNDNSGSWEKEIEGNDRSKDTRYMLANSRQVEAAKKIQMLLANLVLLVDVQVKQHKICSWFLTMIIRELVT